MTHYNASELISVAKAWIADDAARMSLRPAGVPRSAWRQENPVQPIHLAVRDTAFKTKPYRCFMFDYNGNPYDLWVWSTGHSPKVIERIDLRADDAGTRLARYEMI